MFKRFCGRQDQVQAFVLQPEMLRNTEKDSVANPGPAVLQLVVEMVAKLRGEALDLAERWRSRTRATGRERIDGQDSGDTWAKEGFGE